MSGIFGTMSIFQAFDEADQVLSQFRSQKEEIAKLDRFAEKLATVFQAGGKIMVCGNGGSLADAIHFSEELTGKFRQSRPALPALVFSEPGHLTCVGNDFGFEEVFARSVEAFAKPGDILLVLSTSGKSANLINATNAARTIGCSVFGFLGRDGGPLLDICDDSVIFPGIGSDRIQELHMIGLHAIVESVEKILGYA